MQFYTDRVTDQYGNVKSGQSVSVLLNGSLATIYADDGVTTKANPMTTGSDGSFSFYAANGDYTISVGNSSKSVTLFDVLAASTATPTSSSTVLGETAGVVRRFAKDSLGPFVNVKDPAYGADHTGATDSSAAVAAAYAALKARGGGTLLFPNISGGSVYRFYLDVSGVNPVMEFDFQGSTIRPWSAAATNSTIIDADNESANFLDTNITLRSGNFDARTAGTGTGDINHCIRLHWAAIKTDNCRTEYAKVAGVYGYYAQYTKLIDHLFGACRYDANSWGVKFTGPDGDHRSNEVHLVRPKVFSNSNGCYMGGGEKFRMTSPTIQDNTLLGLKLATDDAGNGARAPAITDAYYEINGTDNEIGVCDSPLFINPISETSGATMFYSTSCYDIQVYNAWGNSAITNFNHPAGNSDTAALTWKGGNFTPTLPGTVTNLAHAGPTYLDISVPFLGLEVRRAHTALTGAVDSTAASVPLFNTGAGWKGVKAQVAKGVTTTLFSLTQAAFGTGAYRCATFEVALFLWDDQAAASAYGYSGHKQSYTVLVTNNSGTLATAIVKDSAGTDAGIDTAYQAPGDVTLSAAVVGSVITFSASWPGAGTGAATMSVQAIAYEVRGGGSGNGFEMRPL